MTISTTDNFVEFDGDGSSVAFATPFPFLASTTLEVFKIRKSTLAITPQTLTTDYTVSGGLGAVGTVTFVTAPSALYTVRIVRVEPLTQTTDYVNNSNSDADVQEATIDKLTMICQQLNQKANRSMRLDDGVLDGFSTLLPSDISKYPTYTVIVNDSGDGFTMGVPVAYANGDGRFIKRTILSASGDHTFTSQVTTGQMHVQMVGAGGGGSPVSQPSADKTSVGGGGGAGGFISAWVVIETGGTTYNYTIGAGAAATSAGNSALNGGDTVFHFEQDILTAPGGSGAPLAATDSFLSQAGQGGLPDISGASPNVKGFAKRGGNGKPGFGTFTTPDAYASGGEGGESYFGQGGWQSQTTTTTAGATADGPGAGGGGGQAADAGADADGGAGANGYIIIDEYTGGVYDPGV